jgi:hypothetical protein
VAFFRKHPVYVLEMEALSPLNILNIKKGHGIEAGFI